VTNTCSFLRALRCYVLFFGCFFFYRSKRPSMRACDQYLLLFKGAVLLCFIFWVFFQKIGQNGRPGERKPPRSTSFDETSRMVSVWGRTQKLIFCSFCDLSYRCLRKKRRRETRFRGVSHAPRCPGGIKRCRLKSISEVSQNLRKLTNRNVDRCFFFSSTLDPRKDGRERGGGPLLSRPFCVC